MLFNSIDFAVFLPIVFALYWFVFQRNLRAQNFFLVAASYIFYGWWDWRFLILMTVTILCSYASGLLIDKAWHGADQTATRRRTRTIVAANIVINLLILGFFKYYNFFVQNFVDVFTLFGKPLEVHTLKIILPVGISFYTFQALSYSIDVYRRKIAPTRDLVAFFAFVSFFPQLVAGPIERATNLLSQFYARRAFSYDKAADGMRQILWGLFKKMVVADNCAYTANAIFNGYETMPASLLAVGAIAFTFQIYGDFSGYSDIAIGTARLFGFSLKRNFAFPYFSRDIAEFWRRWHISLTRWFRDYIYIPLGGSRCAKWKVIRNTWVIFLVSGLWHGASWTFVAWGAYHALLFMPLLLLGKNRQYTNTVAENRVLPTWKELFAMLTTFVFVVIGWVIFRAENIHQAFAYMSGICSPSLFVMPVEGVGAARTLLFSAVLIVVEWFGRKNQYAIENIPVKNIALRWCLYFILFISILSNYYSGEQSAFIYFQF
ncbi:MAG: MBOAT family protein [Prevotellaceae bacterium]|jgi:D-alanyl-lipoteichoic acid acyltransferase DltB (MBOAT superfamily)|nr:MBOAT family protein [Prevotellaceae bacterium]